MRGIRPTTGLVLQALFNILGDMQGRSFLDLFAGTGRVAFEACRLGASPVISVELLRGRSKAIWAAKRFDGHTHLSMDVRKGLSWVARRQMAFDVIFADPPYGDGWGRRLPEVILARRSVLVPEGTVVIEHSVDEPLMASAPWRVLQERVYGRSALAFLALEDRSVTEEGTM
ncbi:MAG: DNA methyltransferase [Dethiosulfovibrio peptidovorans]|nr:MAG: DNA methyltransferase [Dethiosulfovibrio peptidovorans]